MTWTIIALCWLLLCMVTFCFGLARDPSITVRNITHQQIVILMKLRVPHSVAIGVSTMQVIGGFLTSPLQLTHWAFFAESK